MAMWITFVLIAVVIIIVAVDTSEWQNNFGLDLQYVWLYGLAYLVGAPYQSTL